MNLSAEELRAIVEARLGKAARAYAEAKGVAAMGYWETAANRLYYAAFDAVSALLLANGNFPHTHSGVIHLFGQQFIRPGLVSADMGRLYHVLFSLRQTGDYDDAYSVSENDVSPNIEPAGRLIECVAILARQRVAPP